MDEDETEEMEDVDDELADDWLGDDLDDELTPEDDEEV
tara:strand:- start:534 stop:647 length:114 start_codon:yes stop_codon:yes gene_type:complete